MRFTNFADKSKLVVNSDIFFRLGVYYNEKDDPLSANLFAVDGEDWRKLRRKFTPAFTSGKMKYMFSTVLAIGDRLRDTLIDTVSKEGDILEVEDIMIRYTCDVIASCVFGIECNSLRSSNEEFFRIGKLTLTNHRHGPLLHAFKASFRELARKLRVKHWHDEISNFYMNITHETIAFREKNNFRRKDLMDILLNMKAQESQDQIDATTINEIAAQVFIFFSAGFDTSSTTLTFCLYHLAQHPEAQMKARKDVEAAYEKYDGKFTYEMLYDMPYIDQVLYGD